MKSLMLTGQWDLALTPGGSLATVDGTARIEQDVSTYERVFQGEQWYNTAAGVPYLDREIASLPPIELVRERARRRALEVPGVAEAIVELDALDQRVLTGRIKVTTSDGESVNVTI